LYAEAGAIDISDVDTITLSYAKKFKLPLQKWNPSGSPRRYFVRGKWINNPDSRQKDVPYDFSATEKRLSFSGIFSHYVSPGIKQLGNTKSKHWSPAVANEIDKLTVAEFLRKRGASKEAIDFLRLGYLGFHGDGLESYSAICALLDEAHYQATNDSFTIRGGNDLLPKAFAHHLADKIQYGVAVTNLVQRDNQVKVIGNRSGISYQLEADYVICAIPLTVLRTIEITPLFNAAKRRAVSELKYTSVSRVYLQARTRIWQKSHPTARVITDNPHAWIEDHTDMQFGKRGIVESHTFGSVARKVSALSPTERLQTCLQQLEKLFPGFEKEFEGGVSKCWDEDEFSRGAYIYYQPGQMNEHFAQIASPEGRIHFAGEHTSKMFASMEGAVESGRRAANEIHARGK
jgi:monoamine oxidase